MINKTLLTVSAIALFAAVPALAADATKQTVSPTSAESKTTGSVSKDVDNAWKNIKKDASQTYEDFKATVIGSEEMRPTDTSSPQVVTIEGRRTASRMIGQDVYNAAGEKVAKVKDIILDNSGKATLVVVADMEFPGIDGKPAAFDYSTLTQSGNDGDVIMPLTEAMIDRATVFSYDGKNTKDGLRTMPANSHSVNTLLDGSVMDPQNNSLANVDDISFRSGKADQIIISFDQIMGLGGERAALKYSDTKSVRKGDDVDFQLSANQTARFEAFKKNTAKSN